MEEVILLDTPEDTPEDTVSSPRSAPVKDVDLHYFLEDEKVAVPLQATLTEITPLMEGKMLTTTLLDYLLQRFINPALITPEMIVPSSEFMPRMKMQLDKLSKTDRCSQKTIHAMQTKFKRFSLGPHHFLALCCESKHFFVFSIKFNACSENVFSEVLVYDSLRKTRCSRSNRPDQVTRNHLSATYLLLFQQFLTEFSFHRMTTKSSLLRDNPELILENAVHMKTPQQSNSIDCGLFGVITLLHLIHGIQIDDLTFTQRDITKLRQGLYFIMNSRNVLTNGMKYLSRNVAPHFFPLLNNKITNETSADHHVSELNAEDNIFKKHDRKERKEEFRRIHSTTKTFV